MTTRRNQADLIAEIYDAALDAGEWGRLPEVLTRAVDGASAVFWIADAATGMQAVTYGLPEQALQLYLAYFHQRDPWAAAASDSGLNFKTALGTDLVPEIRFRQTEFFVDFAKGFDTVEVVGGHIPIGAGRLGGVGVHRSLRVRRFNERHVARLQSLFPHLRRAMQLRDRLKGIDAAGLGFAALETLAIGAVICDAAGRVLFANAAAEAAADGAGLVLGDARHGIGALHAEEGKQLASLIAAAARGAAGGGMSLTGQGGGRLFVLVAPLPRRFAEEPGGVLVTLRPASASPTFGAATLGRLFGLTPAEARLALALLTGRSLAEIGAERNVTENTSRTQLSHVLHKTGTANQRDLVRVLSLLPPLR